MALLDYLRVNPHPVQAIFYRLPAAEFNLPKPQPALGQGLRRHGHPVLEGDLALSPGVRENGIRRDLIVGDRLLHLPAAGVEKSHRSALPLEEEV